MKDTIDSIIINAQILALVEAKNKIQDRIDELERQKEDIMKDQTTEKLLDVINDLISLVKKNTDNINKLAHEIAKLKEVKHD